ncbi:5-oxoprolinase subunit C family protein [Anditalea andensis]|uniref:Carboxyltransferase domain-containing protein n=1 Tax=Anditalea andensis TaxID=1048983 RepID=A0A074L7P9_9BACT|nr:biotin-dependent carboxyltransferase family protein [Anditalea andensis]KEO75883.1 hypothetical protein EL17_22965 [Anditalea andensis]
MARVTLLQPGLFTSIQDTGRYGFSSLGVPSAGAMDQYAHSMANLLLGNPAEAACLEITQSGPVLEFSDETIVLFSGAITPVSLNKGAWKQANHHWLSISKGDVLQIGYLKHGLRSYMAIKGGFYSEFILRSRSQSKGITPHERLLKFDTVSYDSNPLPVTFPTTRVKPAYPWINDSPIDVYPGPEFSLLNEEVQGQIFQNRYTISLHSNRMAIILEERLPNHLPQILTHPVFPGTVQLTPAGKLILLMRDAQVTGGYPRIFQIKEEHLNYLGQMSIGATFRFSLKTF